MITTLENKLIVVNHDLFSKIVNVLKKTLSVKTTRFCES
jgi:hypothetical protein